MVRAAEKDHLATKAKAGAAKGDDRRQLSEEDVSLDGVSEEDLELLGLLGKHDEMTELRERHRGSAVVLEDVDVLGSMEDIDEDPMPTFEDIQIMGKQYAAITAHFEESGKV